MLKARVDLASLGGLTLLQSAVLYERDRVETISLLLKYGASLNDKTKLDKTALHIAAETAILRS